MTKQTPAQRRKAAANKLERMATPANPAVRPGDVTLSAAEARALVRALRS